jgi:hypothetical protein
MNKEKWTRPEIEEFDITERTQLEGEPGNDGPDPFDLDGGGGDTGGGDTGGGASGAPSS